jgi:hypothetical protein
MRLVPRRVAMIVSLLAFIALLSVWHRSYVAVDAVGLRAHRVSRSAGGRWELRFAGVSTRAGLLAIGVVQETTGAHQPDYAYRRDGLTLRGEFADGFWRDYHNGLHTAGFGFHKINVAGNPTTVGYYGHVAFLPVWLPVLLCAWPVALWYRRVAAEAKQFARARRGECPQCGYDLHGGTRDRCPECGAKRNETWPTTA